MNDIIILMWLGDVTRNLDFVLSFWTVLYMLAGLGVLLTFAVCHCSDDFGEDERAANRKFIATFFHSAFWSVPLILIGLALPSKDTIRLAVAFKAGSIVANTTLGQKATEAASAVLDRIIKEAGGSK